MGELLSRGYFLQGQLGLGLAGRLAVDGAIEGNDNDQDASLFEPNYETGNLEEQVQVYDRSMAADSAVIPDQTEAEIRRSWPAFNRFRSSGQARRRVSVVPLLLPQ